MDRRKFLVRSGAAIAGTAVLNPLIARAGGSSETEIPGYGVSGANPQPLLTQSNDLSPYTGAWGDPQLRHLLRRSMFGLPYTQYQAAVALGSMNAVVAKLLATSPLPAKPGTWCDKLNQPDRTITDPAKLLIEFNNKQRLNKYMELSLQGWWFEQMNKEDLSIREKMTLLWSNHFVTGYDSVKAPQYMYTYNQMLRKNALGNMKTFVYEMATDPAMLIFLNGNQNTYQVKNGKVINNANENFARELMELFTLGLTDPKTGEKNYSETDIQQAALALTGWQPTQTAPFVGQLNPLLHNTDSKTFFGQSGNFGMQEIIDMIFAKNGGYNVAYFLCQKIYAALVYWVPNTQVVDAMAKKLIASNWEIAPVLDALLKSAHFYDSNVIGSQLKNPAELFGSLVREFAIALPAYDGAEPIDSGKTDTQGSIIYTDRNPTHTYLIVAMGVVLGQDLLNPPNVKGWSGGHSWVNTGTFPTRKGIAYLAVTNPIYFNGNAPRAKGVKLTFDPMYWVRLIPNADKMTSAQMSNALTDAYLAFDLGPIEGETERYVISGGQPEVDYYLDPSKVAQSAQVIATLPEFQLV